MKKRFSGRIRWLIAGIVVLAIAGGAAFYYTSSTRASTTTTEEAPVQTATAFQGSIVLYANGTGTLAPAREASFGFGTSGQITELNVRIGDTVEAGQVIGEIDNAGALAEYQQAKRSLDDLTTPASFAEAEQAVAEADVAIYNAKQDLEYLISSDVYYWELELATAEETLQAAQADGGSNPTAEQKENIDVASTALSRAQTNLEAAQLRYINEYVPDTFSYTITDTEDTDGDGNTEETYVEAVAPSEAEIAAARATYQLAIETKNEAQAYLDMLNGEALPEDVPGSSLTSLVEAQTALQAAEENLNATQLISPISGTVTDVTASVGDSVIESSIITVADLNQPYTIDAYFDAEDWSKVQVGYETEIVFDILPDDIFTGTVTLVYPELDTSSNSSLVHAIVRLNETIETNLPSGTSAAVDVIGGKAEDAVLIPVEAVREIDDGKYTVFVMEDGTPKLRVIEVGLQNITYAEIKSGLEAGEVVTTGIVETQ
ncbi:MAG TPA: efflux RND transporter periplasmic adaptor subunit [Anaerolineales bacterium]|nr:efflux RND transporter periplasmic adaptor subunit [Anaerolineales bacterium]